MFKRILQLLSIFIVLLLLAGFSAKAAAVSSSTSFSIKYIDVGQGDAALVECDGEYMLIDGGPSSASSTIYTILKNEGVRNLEYMIATHPDEDHIGGLSGALNYAKAKSCYCPVTEHDTKTFKSLTKYLNKQKVSITTPTAGDVLYLGSAKITFLGPIGNVDDSNNSSIVLRIEYGQNSFLFMGDAEKEEENQILKKWNRISSDVIKIGHHGSSSSTTIGLLNKTKPSYAVISVGRDNSYGHPTQTILDRLNRKNITVYRTDLQGDIIVTSDGTNLTFNTEKRAEDNDIQKNTVETTPKKKTSEVTVTQNEQNSSTEVTAAVQDNPVVVAPELVVEAPASTSNYVLNTNTKKFHYPTCSSVNEMKAKNRQDVNMSRDEVTAMGYVACKRCNP